MNYIGSKLKLSSWIEEEVKKVVGDETWQGASKSDENGCVGCFWYDPYKWREELNKKITS